MCQNDQIAPHKILFRKAMTLWPLGLCKIVKQSVQQNQSCEDAPFWVLNDPLVLKKNFFGKAINMIFMYLFFLKKKKILRAIPNYEDVPFSRPKWPVFPEQNFF